MAILRILTGNLRSLQSVLALWAISENDSRLIHCVQRRRAEPSQPQHQGRKRQYRCPNGMPMTTTALPPSRKQWHERPSGRRWRRAPCMFAASHRPHGVGRRGAKLQGLPENN